jgi:hypothetical protein
MFTRFSLVFVICSTTKSWCGKTQQFLIQLKQPEVKTSGCFCLGIFTSNLIKNNVGVVLEEKSVTKLKNNLTKQKIIQFIFAINQHRFLG